jgi:dihydroxyacid dehydratase/phosphogluconate dehydratase
VARRARRPPPNAGVGAQDLVCDMRSGSARIGAGTRQAFENAMVMVMATGGSTNAVR